MSQLKNQFSNESKENKFFFKKLRKDYDLNSHSFNSGVTAFSTDTITTNTFSKLLALIEKYKKIGLTSDQVAFNLFFYKKWKRLPLVYNLLLFVFDSAVKKIEAQSIIPHFAKSLRVLFDIRNIFYKEWCENIRGLDLIDFNKAQLVKDVWTQQKIKKFQRAYKKHISNICDDIKSGDFQLSKIRYFNF